MKDYIIGTLGSLVQDVQDGKENPLRAWAVLTEIEKYIEKCKEATKVFVSEEVNKYPEQKFEAHGFVVEKRNGRAVWNFKNCNSWVEKNRQLKEHEEILKHSYQIYNKGGVIGVDENGEQVEIPTVTYTDQIITVRAK
jgi:predicted ATPase